MKTTDYIAMSLEQSQGWVLGLASDIRDAPLTAPTPNGGNHPLWCIGHLAYSESNLLHSFVLGESNPLADWKEIFGQGSQPTDDADKYPSMDDVFGKLEEVRSKTLETLRTMSDDDLDKPSHAPEEMKKFFGTIGQCFSAMTMHFTFHGGQIADARRAAGRAPVMG